MILPQACLQGTGVGGFRLNLETAVVPAGGFVTSPEGEVGNRLFSGILMAFAQIGQDQLRL
jgi:hypothetical protein